MTTIVRNDIIESGNNNNNSYTIQKCGIIFIATKYKNHILTDECRFESLKKAREWARA